MFNIIKSDINSEILKSNQIKIFISINNDDNNRYSTYKGNIVIYRYTYIHSNTNIHIHITEVK